MENNLVLGTAQLGMKYGIANINGKPGFETACRIIKAAWDKGVRYFDTARSYGTSEQLLGKIFDCLNIADKVFVVSKVPGRFDKISEAHVMREIEKSIKLLNINYLYGILLHDPANLSAWNKNAERIVKKMRKTGLVRRIGVSVYNSGDALRVLNSDAFDMMQMPFNLFDQHYYKDNIYRLARMGHKPVFIRSIFLQGLLLMHAPKLKGRFGSFADYFAKRDKLCREFGLNKKELALGYVKKRAGGAHIIFGAETPQQVIDTAGIFSKVALQDAVIKRVEKELSVEDENIINPSKWNK